LTFKWYFKNGNITVFNFGIFQKMWYSAAAPNRVISRQENTFEKKWRHESIEV